MSEQVSVNNIIKRLVHTFVKFSPDQMDMLVSIGIALNPHCNHCPGAEMRFYNVKDV